MHQPIVDFLQREAPDVMLVSPLVDCGSDQVDVIKAARACGVRTAVCVASWDNLTNKGAAAHRARSGRRLERCAEA